MTRLIYPLNSEPILYLIKMFYLSVLQFRRTFCVLMLAVGFWFLVRS
jgi:hypothetical protein